MADRLICVLLLQASLFLTPLNMADEAEAMDVEVQADAGKKTVRSSAMTVLDLAAWIYVLLHVSYDAGQGQVRQTL